MKIKAVNTNTVWIPQGINVDRRWWTCGSVKRQTEKEVVNTSFMTAALMATFTATEAEKEEIKTTWE